MGWFTWRLDESQKGVDWGGDQFVGILILCFIRFFWVLHLVGHVREFSEEYLGYTRRDMWEENRNSLEPLALQSRETILEAGAGSGEFTRVLRSESPGTVLALDADRNLLSNVAPPRILGDANNLPFVSDAADLVTCQALLVNLPDPSITISEFARVSSDLVAAVEPDNSEVRIESSVDAEAPLARRARSRYLNGVETDASLGAVADQFRAAGLSVVSVARFEHERLIEPPYSDADFEAARRSATGAGLAADRRQLLAGDTSLAEYDQLREEWRAMGRKVIDQMQDEMYYRRETVPFYVTVGRVGEEPD